MICPKSGDLVSELSDPGSFGLLSFVRRKKRLCHKSKLSHLLQYVTILALSKKHFAFSLKSCELFDRARACTGTKRVILVKAFIIKQKTEIDWLIGALVTQPGRAPDAAAQRPEKLA